MILHSLCTGACPSDWTNVDGTCFSPPRKTDEWTRSDDCSTNCDAVVQLCTDVGAKLATKEETQAWLDNGGDSLGKQYGLTSTMQGDRYWLANFGWATGCCHHNNRFFVCAKLAGIASKLQLFLVCINRFPEFSTY